MAAKVLMEFEGNMEWVIEKGSNITNFGIGTSCRESVGNQLFSPTSILLSSTKNPANTDILDFRWEYEHIDITLC